MMEMPFSYAADVTLLDEGMKPPAMNSSLAQAQIQEKRASHSEPGWEYLTLVPSVPKVPSTPCMLMAMLRLLLARFCALIGHMHIQTA